MRIGQAQTAALSLTIPGLLAFILAVVAENKKPTDPTGLPGLVYDPVADKSTCHYPEDATIALGAVAVIFLFTSAVLAVVAFYFPYNGTKIPRAVLWRSTGLFIFTILSLIIFFVAEALLLWAIIVETHHRKNNVHDGQIQECPSAKAGLFGGAGFLALDTTLFFLIALMLTTNARADYLFEEEADDKGSYGEVTTIPPPVQHAADRV